MESIIEHISAWVLQNPSWTDLIIGAGMLIQGELTVLFSMYLVVNGSISWTQFFSVALITLTIGESFVYFFGKIMRNTRFGWKFYKKHKSNKKLQSYTYYLKTNMKKLLIVAKFLPATNFVILSLIGWSKTTFKQFIKAYLTSIFIWFGTMVIFSYFFMSGLHYLSSAKIFKRVEIGIAIIFVIILFGEQILRKILKKYASIGEKAELIGEFVEDKIEEKTKNPVV